MSDLDPVQQISGMAVDLLRGRLKDDPESFSPASLVRLWVEAEKLNLAAKRASKPIESRPEVRLLQFVASEGLPKERQVELISEGIKRMEAFGMDTKELRSALDNLLGVNEAGKMLAIEEESSASA